MRSVRIRSRRVGREWLEMVMHWGRSAPSRQLRGDRRQAVANGTAAADVGDLSAFVHVIDHDGRLRLMRPAATNPNTTARPERTRTMRTLVLGSMLALGLTMIAAAVTASAPERLPAFLHEPMPYREGEPWSTRPGPGQPGLPTITSTLSFDQPGEVDIDPLTGRVYVANYGNNTVSVLDGWTDRTIATIPVGAGPGGIVFDRGRVFVANSFDGTISVINARTNKVIKTIDTGTIFSQQLAVNHHLRKLYVAVYQAPVLVYDLDRLVQIGSIPGDDTNFIAVNERTNTVYVTNYNDATLNVIDSRTDRIVHTIPVGPAAFPDGCYETDTCTIDPAGPDGIAVNTQTNRVYVNNVITGTLVVVDGRTNTVLATVQQLPGQFWSAVDEATNRVYSTNFAESTLSVLDGRTNTILGTIKIGGGFSPQGCFTDQSTCTSFGASSSSLAFSPLTGKIYVPNFGINTVTVLSTRPGPHPR